MTFPPFGCSSRCDDSLFIGGGFAGEATVALLIYEVFGARVLDDELKDEVLAYFSVGRDISRSRFKPSSSSPSAKVLRVTAGSSVSWTSGLVWLTSSPVYLETPKFTTCHGRHDLKNTSEVTGWREGSRNLPSLSNHVFSHQIQRNTKFRLMALAYNAIA